MYADGMMLMSDVFYLTSDLTLGKQENYKMRGLDRRGEKFDAFLTEIPHLQRTNRRLDFCKIISIPPAFVHSILGDLFLNYDG